jgi:hypothetical protein
MISHLDLKMEFGNLNHEYSQLGRIDEFAAPAVYRSRLGPKSNNSILSYRSNHKKLESFKRMSKDFSSPRPIGYSSTGGTSTKIPP